MKENQIEVNPLRPFTAERSADPLYDNRSHPHFKPSALVERLDQPVTTILVGGVQIIEVEAGERVFGSQGEITTNGN